MKKQPTSADRLAQQARLRQQGLVATPDEPWHNHDGGFALDAHEEGRKRRKRVYTR